MHLSNNMIFLQCTINISLILLQCSRISNIQTILCSNIPNRAMMSDVDFTPDQHYASVWLDSSEYNIHINASTALERLQHRISWTTLVDGFADYGELRIANVTLLKGGDYQICWCGASKAECGVKAEVWHSTAGYFRVNGPGSVRFFYPPEDANTANEVPADPNTMEVGEDFQFRIYAPLNSGLNKLYRVRLIDDTSTGCQRALDGNSDYISGKIAEDPDLTVSDENANLVLEDEGPDGTDDVRISGSVNYGEHGD